MFFTVSKESNSTKTVRGSPEREEEGGWGWRVELVGGGVAEGEERISGAQHTPMH